MSNDANDETLQSISNGTGSQSSGFSDETRSSILVIREIHMQSNILKAMQEELKQQTSLLRRISMAIGFMSFVLLIAIIVGVV